MTGLDSGEQWRYYAVRLRMLCDKKYIKYRFNNIIMIVPNEVDKNVPHLGIRNNKYYKYDMTCHL